MSGTKAAATTESIEDAAWEIRRRILRLFAVSAHGLTCAEVEHLLGGEDQTVSVRVSELCQQGAIRYSGSRRWISPRRSDRIYYITPFGRKLVG